MSEYGGLDFRDPQPLDVRIPKCRRAEASEQGLLKIVGNEPALRIQRTGRPSLTKSNRHFPVSTPVDTIEATCVGWPTKSRNAAGQRDAAVEFGGIMTTMAIARVRRAEGGTKGNEVEDLVAKPEDSLSHLVPLDSILAMWKPTVDSSSPSIHRFRTVIGIDGSDSVQQSTTTLAMLHATPPTDTLPSRTQILWNTLADLGSLQGTDDLCMGTPRSGTSGEYPHADGRLRTVPHTVTTYGGPDRCLQNTNASSRLQVQHGVIGPESWNPHVLDESGLRLPRAIFQQPALEP
ncbi:uncharacterized protein MKK02DRAFT_32490 [Dioszegia hungarica]|uniref:Uncharacterized protein n=1 Tax=Dioszegia hungarica TaxID=4972 RepID=A0AA38HAZ8_9TREE|nr:uncharacterized protein MKK02DRAFT_32490 [Dioszegia hungarica]KAI9637703.1 hypothetical protein MKK02DRAFT_32490 [Dioszegia hungarica]